MQVAHVVHEELQRLDVEVRRMAEYIESSEKRIVDCATATQVTDPLLSFQLRKRLSARACANNYLRHRIAQIISMPNATCTLSETTYTLLRGHEHPNSSLSTDNIVGDDGYVDEDTANDDFDAAFDILSFND